MNLIRSSSVHTRLIDPRRDLNMLRLALVIATLLCHHLWALTWLGCNSACMATRLEAINTTKQTAPSDTCESDSECCCKHDAPEIQREASNEAASSCSRPCVIPQGASVPEDCQKQCCIVKPTIPVLPPGAPTQLVSKHAWPDLSTGPSLADVTRIVINPIAHRDWESTGPPSMTSRMRRAVLCIRTI